MKRASILWIMLVNARNQNSPLWIGGIAAEYELGILYGLHLPLDSTLPIRHTSYRRYIFTIP